MPAMVGFLGSNEDFVLAVTDFVFPLVSRYLELGKL